MDVKVGQVWRSSWGTRFEVVAVSDKEFVLSTEDGFFVKPTSRAEAFMMDCVLLKDGVESQSDLEIVQKALEQDHCFVEITGDGGWHLFERVSNESIGIGGDTVLGLLTWAKQTIGE